MQHFVPGGKHATPERVQALEEQKNKKTAVNKMVDWKKYHSTEKYEDRRAMIEAAEMEHDNGNKRELQMANPNKSGMAHHFEDAE